MALPFANAGDPFDRPDADVILRSHDNIDFRTFKVLLSLASKFFSDMFSMPQPLHSGNDQEPRDDLPVLLVDSPSSVLKNLLLYCHPGGAPELTSSLHDVQNLATKYQMFEVAKRIYKDRIWQEHELPPPLMLDAIKKRVGLDENLYLAAISIVLSPGDEAADVVRDLNLVTKSQYDCILRYRDKCRDKAKAIAFPHHNHYTWMPGRSVEYSWHRTDVTHGGLGCQLGGNIFIGHVSGRSMTRRWWMDYMGQAKDRLVKRPCGTTVTTGEHFENALKRGSGCNVCSRGLEVQFREFTATFAAEVDKAVSTVVLEKLDFTREASL